MNDYLLENSKRNVEHSPMPKSHSDIENNFWNAVF